MTFGVYLIPGGPVKGGVLLASSESGVELWLGRCCVTLNLLYSGDLDFYMWGGQFPQKVEVEGLADTPKGRYYNHHPWHHHGIITNILLLPLDYNCHLLCGHRQLPHSFILWHLQFRPWTQLSSGDFSLILSTFLPLSVPVLPERGHLIQGGGFDLGLGQKAYHISMASVLHLKKDM